MAKELLPQGKSDTFRMRDVTDYGCAGRGRFDPFEKTLGKHIDIADGHFYSWKKCIQCAAGNKKIIPEYKYDSSNDDCCKYIRLAA